MNFVRGMPATKSATYSLAGIQDDVGRAAGLDNSPVPHDGDASANSNRLVQVVRDEQGRLFHRTRQLPKIDSAAGGE